MNEQIRELARQCTTVIDSTTDEKEFDHEKFARLIIQEVNDVVYSLLEENTGAEVVVRVKEHFGVE